MHAYEAVRPGYNNTQVKLLTDVTHCNGTSFPNAERWFRFFRGKRKARLRRALELAVLVGQASKAQVDVKTRRIRVALMQPPLA
jgi:hypothetical protein